MCSPSRGRSYSGVRPPSVNAWGTVESARSTTSPGILATVVSRSTVAPCSSSTSRAFCEWNMTPTFSMTSRVDSWICLISSALEQLELDPLADVAAVCVGQGVLSRKQECDARSPGRPRGVTTAEADLRGRVVSR